MLEFLAGIVLAATPVAAEQTMLLRDAGEPALCVHRVKGSGPAVLFVHGSTFPADLSINYRIQGRSWADDLHERSFDIWSFDFAGYGCSERPKKQSSSEIPGRAAAAARQIERVVRHVRSNTGRERVSIIAHSWGTIPASLFAGLHPEWLDRLVLFGPVAERNGPPDPPNATTRLVTKEDQWRSFQSGVPAGQESPIARSEFETWVDAYLRTDEKSAERMPPSVEVPAGPDADFSDAWAGHLPYEPSRIVTPTLIVRGEWDRIATDSDARWLRAALSHVPGGASDIKLPQGAHRMHLERNRQALFDAVGEFLREPQK